jgi:hypothetical protein
MRGMVLVLNIALALVLASLSIEKALHTMVIPPCSCGGLICSISLRSPSGRQIIRANYSIIMPLLLAQHYLIGRVSCLVCLAEEALLIAPFPVN